MLDGEDGVDDEYLTSETTPTRFFAAFSSTRQVTGGTIASQTDKDPSTSHPKMELYNSISS